jgi:hypothetical protein
MGFVVAVVVLQTVVTLLLVVVTVGLARRLRAHSDLLAGLLEGNDKLLPVGSAVPAFSTSATDGTLVDNRGLRGPAAVALMAVDCPHCRTNLPEFVAYVRGAGYRREQALAVVAVRDTTDDAAATEMVESLSSAATVVREPATGGAVTEAFTVQAYPSFYLVGADGTLTAGAHSVRKLPNTAPSRAEDHTATTVGLDRAQ